MARFSSLSVAAFIAVLSVIPSPANAGPACSRRNWGTGNCVAACKSKWGWPGKAMGTDPWGAVMQPASSTTDMSSVVSKACGTATPAGKAASAPSNATQPAMAIPSYTSASSASISSSSSSANATSSTSSSSSSAKPTTTSSHSSSSSSSSKSSEKPTSTPPPPPPSTTAKPSSSSAKPSSSSSSAASTSTGSSGGSGSGGSTSQSDIDQYLSAHNSIRSQHGASPLTWSDDAASKAQQWANNCKFVHSGGSLGPFGENLAAGTGDSYDIAAAIKSWTDEVSQYDASNPVPSHFTQVVWKGTTQVGCALQMCDGIFSSSFGQAKFYVCEYSAQGNIIGQFAQNVQV